MVNNIKKNVLKNKTGEPYDSPVTLFLVSSYYAISISLAR